MVISILLILGLAFGSFVNALVWRVRQQSLPKKKQAASSRDLSIATGRSMCPHCKHTLASYDLLPVVSWLSLGGKCRYCRHKIGWQYPVVELFTAGLFAVSYLYWPFELLAVLDYTVFAAWLSVLVLFMALIVYDARWMLLPNRLVFPLVGISTLFALGRGLQEGFDPALIALLAGSVAVASGIFYVLFQVSDGRWIGGGDVKLGLALGLLLGTPLQAFMMLFLASVIGLLFAIPTVKGSKPTLGAQIPFGPCLMAATIIVVLFGQDIWHWYETTIFLTA